MARHPECLRPPPGATALTNAHTLVHVAAAAANAAVLERLLVCAATRRLPGSGRLVARSREDVVNARNARGMTPLMLAAGARGGAECVRMLLTAGADAWATDCCGGRTALFFAAASDEAESVDALLSATEGQQMPAPSFPNVEGASYVDARTVVGFTALHVAVAADARRALRSLLRAGPRLSTPSLYDSYDFIAAPRGTCPIHLAARFNRREAAKMVLVAYVSRATPTHTQKKQIDR